MRMPKLTEEEIAAHLENLTGWQRAGDTVTKQYQFQDFVGSLEFVNQVAEVAEDVNHHPDIDIRYNKVTLSLTTHDSGGLTQNDIDLAATADELAAVISA